MCALHVTFAFAFASKSNSSLTFGFFTIGKSDRSVRSDRNKMQFLRIFTMFNLKVRVQLIFPVLARLWAYCQIINTNNSKK